MFLIPILVAYIASVRLSRRLKSVVAALGGWIAFNLTNPIYNRYLVALLLMMRSVRRDPEAASYTDLALTRGEPEDEAKLELLAPAAAKRKAA